MQGKHLEITINDHANDGSEELFIAARNAKFLELNFAILPKWKMSREKFRELGFLSNFEMYQIFIASSMALPNLPYPPMLPIYVEQGQILQCNSNSSFD